MSTAYDDYARSLRWVERLSAAASEARYYRLASEISANVIATLEALESEAKAWHSEAAVSLRREILQEGRK